MSGEIESKKGDVTRTLPCNMGHTNDEYETIISVCYLNMIPVLEYMMTLYHHPNVEYCVYTT